MNFNNNYFSHLVFDNSLTSENYSQSRTLVTAPSELKTIKNRLPVTESHWISPPNALELSWRSRYGGDWTAEIHVESWRGRDMHLEGDHLCLWMCAEQGIVDDALPTIQLVLEPGGETPALPLNQFVEQLPTSEWVHVKIPFAAFASAGDFGNLRQIIFQQSVADDQPHTIYLDEIKVRHLDDNPPVQAPTGLTAHGYDSHVDLVWDDITDSAVEYIMVYRSDDGMNFVPIGIQNPTFNRFTTPVNEHKTTYFRITSVNAAYQESAPSAVASAITRALNDDELLTMTQEAHFRYYWEGAHPDAGLALESIPGDPNLVALGAAGFGMMTWIVGVERGFITRQQAVERMHTALAFLDKADRYHGVWSHFMDGRTGKTIPLFGKYDNGGDLVETAFMCQGLLTARQYFDHDTNDERQLRDTITRLWEGVEWNWCRNPPDSDFLMWHWSPDYGWHINHSLIGWNETLIVYLMAIASPTHPAPPELYHRGWASQSEVARKYRENWGQTSAGNLYTNGEEYYGLKLDVGVGSGGPLFFIHYSFLGFDPRGKRDRYCNYFDNNRQIALINHRYCVANPGGYGGYSDAFWGLTASDDHIGYRAHEANENNDNGTMTPTGALGSFPYTPALSMNMLRYTLDHVPELWGIYGFRDAINLTENWLSPIFMGLNQAPIVIMIENNRTGLLWRLFMSNPEIAPMLAKIGFVDDERKD